MTRVAMMLGMQRLGGNLRSLVGAVAATVLAVTLVASGASAAVVGYTFQVTLGAPCVRGSGVAGEMVTVTLRDRDGTRLARRTTMTDADDGGFQACLGTPVLAGMTLVVKGTGGGHTLVVPRFDARVDRVTNRLTGHAPAGAPVDGPVYECIPGICAPMFDHSIDLTATPQGTFSVDVGTDIDGSEFVSLRTYSLNGDVLLTRANAPYLVVRQPGAADVRFFPTRSGPVTVTLRAPGGALRASVTRTVTSGRAKTLTFRRDGNDVRVRAGDRIDADFAADVGMTAPALKLTFDVPGGSVSGQCFSDQPLTLTVIPTTGERTNQFEQAGPGGVFTAVVAGLASGWQIEATCQDARGDRFRLWGEVP